MNAQVGKENTYKTTIGKHSLHDRRNDNGIRLINFAISKNMYNCTRFPRKNIHKETYLREADLKSRRRHRPLLNPDLTSE
ncbi:craniofacial development protein 2-like [Aphis craccivora]|uniref:Craniofacial development protein 2-like n=1 Tax=Aphis craccivora TaxID=307492 RepID=A0A6G0ZGB8_APHCR|nr:craniofacial development protein 2-like [Aphis craccivora]